MGNPSIHAYEISDTPDWTTDTEHGHDTNPYLHSIFGPTKYEHTVDRLEVVEGKVPENLSGVYVRNGPNARFKSKGLHHWFDGDGMLHAACCMR